MTPARTGDDGGTYVDVSTWTEEPATDTDAAAPAASDPPDRPQKSRRHWLFGLIGVALGLGVVWSVYTMDDPTPRLPADHPATTAPAAQTPEPVTPEQLAELKAKVDAAPASKDDRLIYGVALYDDAQYGLAEEQWLEAARLDPADPAPWYNLGFLYLSLDPPADDKAEAAWRTVVDLAPGTSMAATVSEHLDRLDTVLPDGAAPASAAPAR